MRRSSRDAGSAECCPEGTVFDDAVCAARWYAVQCLANREATAVAHLQNQGLEVFLPRQRKTRRHARKFDVVLVPFFPSYLFVRLDVSRYRWRSVNSTRGVARLVMQGKLPAPAPVGVVEGLRDACDEAGVLRFFEEDALERGQTVRISSGALAGFVGELDRLDDAGRVRVLLEIMGGQVPIMLPRQSVVRATVQL